jgi:uncharacterized protein YecT (DUF1311 family)
MRILFLFSCFLLFSLSIFAQKLTDQKLAEITKSAEQKAQQYKGSLKDKDLSKDQIEFSVDTFKINRISELCMEVDYTTVGMNQAVMRLTADYDKLLNKYYQKLLKVLEEDDKKVLIEAERAWMKFRDAEKALIGMMTKEQYSGGGTIQSNIATGAYADLVIKRTLDIFNYYDAVLK